MHMLGYTGNTQVISGLWQLPKVSNVVKRRLKSPSHWPWITRTKTRTLEMHALNWLIKGGRILRGAVQPIQCALFTSLSLSSSYCCSVTRPYLWPKRIWKGKIYTYPGIWVQRTHWCSRTHTHSTDQRFDDTFRCSDKGSGHRGLE